MNQIVITKSTTARYLHST